MLVNIKHCSTVHGRYKNEMLAAIFPVTAEEFIDRKTF